MKLQVASDLHLEFSDIRIPNVGADVLILAGDILVIEKLLRPNSEQGQKFRDFLGNVSENFTHVIYVAGNHEFYGGGHFYEGVDKLRIYCKDNFDNVYFLEDDVKMIDDVLFVGATLWTDMNRGDPLTLFHVKQGMNDYRAIKDDRNGYEPIRPQQTIERHIRSKEYIQTVIENAELDQKIVVVGHHTPSWQSCAEQYRHDYLMNGAYHNNLDEYIMDQPKIKLWVHGHTHVAFDYIIGETRIICNPRGYESYDCKEHTG
jgi:predicted phosphodiesterase